MRMPKVKDCNYIFFSIKTYCNPHSGRSAAPLRRLSRLRLRLALLHHHDEAVHQAETEHDQVFQLGLLGGSDLTGPFDVVRSQAVL